MGLTLLTPLALLLAGLLGLPILAHMARQTPRDRHEFGAMLLLQRVVKRLRRRRRLKDLLLLSLRLLAGLAMVIAVSGPELSYPGGIPEFGGSGRVVLVLDRSMSMSLQDGGSTLLQRARERSIGLVRGLPQEALVGVVVFGSSVDRLTPNLTSDHQRAILRLQEVQPSHGTSNLRGALLEARKMLGGEAGEVLVYSDEAGPRMVAEAQEEIGHLVAAGSSVIPRVIAADPPRNVAVTSALYGDGLEGGMVAVRLTNFGPDPIEVACEVTLPDGAAIPIFSDIPPFGESEERITIPLEAEGGVGQVECDDPDLRADDSRYFHLPTVGASRVLVVDGDPGDTPTRSEIYFLERALAPWGDGKSGVTIDITTPGGLMDLDPAVHRVVFLSNVSDPRPFGPRLTEFVRQGGNLVITAGDNVTAERYNAALGGILPAAFRKSRSVADVSEAGVPMALPDLANPMFAPFSRAGRGGFAKVRSHTLLTLEPYTDLKGEITTLLSYENGMPAMVERKIGAGRVVVWTSTIDLGWGNLPLQSVFMPLVQRLVTYLGGDAGGRAARMGGVVSEGVSIDLPDLALDLEVEGPDGQLVTSRVDGSKLLFTPEVPGAYEVRSESAPTLAWVAVNLDPSESDVRPSASIAAVERDLKPELLERRVDLGRGFLILVLVLLVGQSLLAVRGGA
jgi:hypothetical protein